MTASLPPRTAAQLEECLDACLDAALSPPRLAAGPARELAALTRREQDFVLHWAEVVARDNAELACQFTVFAAQGLRLMNLEAVESWLLQAMDLYDKKGQMPAIRALREVAEFAASQREQQAGVALEEITGVLERFVCGLNGRALGLAPAEAAFTDTETIFLPPVLGRLPDKAANFRLYKAMTVHQWAQNWYGTWRAGQVLEALDTGRLGEDELERLHALESVRLDACIARAFPGLRRDMRALRAALDPPDPEWSSLTARLQAPSARLADSLELLAATRGCPVPSCCYRGVLRPEAVRARFAVRSALERERFRIAVATLIEDQDEARPAASRKAAEIPPETRARLRMQALEDPEMPEGFRYRMLLDGKPVAPPETLESIIESILQDHGEIPPEYLVPAGPGQYRQNAPDGAADRESGWTHTAQEEGVFLYDEWDFRRQHHRKHWCVLREQSIAPAPLDGYHQTLKNHGGLLHSLRRTFEALRGDDRILRRQTQGEEVDIDALVEARADAHAGLEMSDRLFCRRQRDERNVGVLFLVDMSGSTKGWINQAEREALILLSEVLETLGDRFAIYGFSGWTRNRCEVYPVKEFDQPYDAAARGRICGIEPRDYTRMGAPIRHLSRRLKEQEVRTKLLITLSDGKPDDYDPQYRGEYGIEDTRQALLEARLEGIHPFCITIDEEGPDYLPRLYGAANYTVVSDVSRLPAKVAEVYRKLTH